MAAGVGSGLNEQDMMEVATTIVHSFSPPQQVKKKKKKKKKKRITIFDIWGKMETVVQEAMDKALPKDAHLRCNGRIRIATSQVKEDRTWFLPLASLLPVSPGNVWETPKMFGSEALPFQTKDDLIQACLCSSHVPFYMNGNFSRRWRGKNWVRFFFIYKFI